MPIIPVSRLNRGQCYNHRDMTGIVAKMKSSPYGGVYTALLISNAVSLLLFMARALDAGNLRSWFLLWNLALGWLPLLFAWLLVKRLKVSLWQSWGNVGLTLLWFGFLPNSFYLASDLIHLSVTGEVSLLYDVVLFFSCIFNSYTAGFFSVLLVHRALATRISKRSAYLFINLVLLLCSFAIYLGRYLRWNTWDVLINPAGLLFDVSDRIINPSAHPQAFTTTITFFVLIASMYGVVWQVFEVLTRQKK